MHVVAVDPKPIAIAAGRLWVHGVRAAKDNYAWLIVDRAAGEAALVDAPFAEPVLAACQALGVRLTTIFITHTHGDHVGVLHDLARSNALDGLRVVGPRKVRDAIPGISEAIDEGDTVTFGGVGGTVWLTEGHLDGHVSYVFPGAVFVGDTLFAGGCGYLFTGPPATMAGSLARLATLPAETWVFCAHEYTEDNLAFARSVDGDNAALLARWAEVQALRAAGLPTVPSTIGTEQATNPFLRAMEPVPPAGLVAVLARELPALPLGTPAERFTATRKLKDLKRYRAPPPPGPA